ncbi:MAG: hypothetical protein JNK09_15105 [Prolixibacteraceae bacterium]|nr:hypothetical protein [Prolixibacteraceae bacterium]
MGRTVEACNKSDSIVLVQQNQRLILLDSKVDSLLKVTSKFQEEKNYFATAISSQTTIFSIIITITLFLFGFISYVRFNLLIKQYKKETESIIDRQNQIIDSVREANKVHEKLIYTALGNTYALISDVFKSKKSMVFIHTISGSKYHNSSGYSIGALTLLKKTKEIIDTSEFYEKYFSAIIKSDNEGKIVDNLKALMNSEDRDVMAIAVYILNKYLSYQDQYLNSTKK